MSLEILKQNLTILNNKMVKVGRGHPLYPELAKLEIKLWLAIKKHPTLSVDSNEKTISDREMVRRRNTQGGMR